MDDFTPEELELASRHRERQRHHEHEALPEQPALELRVDGALVDLAGLSTRMRRSLISLQAAAQERDCAPIQRLINKLAKVRRKRRTREPLSLTVQEAILLDIKPARLAKLLHWHGNEPHITPRTCRTAYSRCRDRFGELLSTLTQQDTMNLILQEIVAPRIEAAVERGVERGVAQALAGESSEPTTIEPDPSAVQALLVMVRFLSEATGTPQDEVIAVLSKAFHNSST